MNFSNGLVWTDFYPGAHVYQKFIHDLFSFFSCGLQLSLDKLLTKNCESGVWVAHE